MAHAFADIPEIAQLRAGEGLIRLPYGQDVPFPPRVRAIADTAAFQRLRHISQLGLAATVYPGATHSRLEHALGVFRNALLYLAQLGRDRQCAEILDSHTARVLLCAALLHDLGHWPFCHPIEDMELPEVPPHEAFARNFLETDPTLRGALEDEWGVEVEEVLDLLEGTGGSPGCRLARSILSGPIDIDKLDYLERDSLHAGVPYGRNLDKNRLIASLVLNEAGDGLAISSKGKTAAELMVFARYVMFSEVYWHKAVRAATCMFTRAFYELRETLDLDAFFAGTDTDAIRALRAAAAGSPWQELTEGVFGPLRRLHKEWVEWSALNGPQLYEKFAQRPYPELVRLTTALGEEIASEADVIMQPGDLLIDAPPPGREVEFRVDLYDPKARTYRPLESVSPVTEALARRQFDDAVKRVRLFVHPRLREPLERVRDLPEHVARAIGRI